MDTTHAPAGRRQALAPYALSLLRIFTAFVFVQSGTMKLFAFPMGMPPNGGTAVFPTQIWFAGVIEVVLGTLALLGLCTRTAAFILSGEMAVAYLQFFAPAGFWPIMNNGALPALCCFIWLYISAAGPGPWSLDAHIKRKWIL